MVFERLWLRGLDGDIDGRHVDSMDGRDVRL